MKIVDKYELAKLPNGTFFYELRGSTDCMLDVSNDSLMVLDGFRAEYEKGKPFFNGVTYLIPDMFNEDDSNCGIFTKEDLPYFNNRGLELTNIDTDSNDYPECSKFLVLEKEDVKRILFTFNEYYKEAYEKEN